MLIAAFWVIVVFAAIVMVHEFGHFLFARLFDMQVDEFCIGIGPKICGYRRGGTFYGICLFPIGGYVNIAGMDVGYGDDTTGGAGFERAFNTQPVWRRFWVIAGGPVFNFILAVVLVFLIGFFGYPKNKVRVGSIFPGGPAEEAGFKAFDIVTLVNGSGITSVSMFQASVRKSPGVPLEFTVERDGTLVKLTATPRVMPGYNDDRPSLGVSLGKYPDLKNTLAGVLPGSPAFTAGVRVGDGITAVNGKAAEDGWDVLELIESEGHAQSPAGAPSEAGGDAKLVFKPILLTVRRDDETMQVSLVPVDNPQFDANVAYTGLAFQPILVRLPFGEAVQTTLQYLEDIAMSLVDGIRTLFERPTANLVGPVGITNMIAQSAKSGPYQLIIIAILLNVNLGLINLFPIPALDGGRLVFLLLEGVFRVRVSHHKEALVHLVGFVMLIGLILVVTFKEVYGLLQ